MEDCANLILSRRRWWHNRLVSRSLSCPAWTVSQTGEHHHGKTWFFTGQEGPLLTCCLALPLNRCQSVRQLAAVELRKRISQKSGELWINVSQSERDQIKQNLPEVIIAEPSKLVRHSGARVIAAIAYIELPLQQWPELLPLISRCCTSPQTHERELGIFVLFTVLESIVDGFSEHVQELYQLFDRLLQDPESSDVRVTTVRSLGVLAQYISSEDKREVQLFQQLLPSMIAIVQDRLDANDETSARQLFDVFETLLILEAPILSKHIPNLVQFFMQCGANRNYDDELRIMALNALLWTVK